MTKKTKKSILEQRLDDSKRHLNIRFIRCYSNSKIQIKIIRKSKIKHAGASSEKVKRPQPKSITANYSRSGFMSVWRRLHLTSLFSSPSTHDSPSEALTHGISSGGGRRRKKGGIRCSLCNEIPS